MSGLLDFMSGRFAADLVCALLHTLWQALVIAGLLYVFLKRTGMFGVCRRVIEPAFPASGDSRAKLTSQYSNRLPTKMKKTKTRTGSN